jgi:hypothetical protein
MSSNNEKDAQTDVQRDAEATGTSKRPYEKPAWEVEEVFEKAALGCQKADDSCAPGPIQS